MFPCKTRDRKQISGGHVLMTWSLIMYGIAEKIQNRFPRVSIILFYCSHSLFIILHIQSHFFSGILSVKFILFQNFLVSQICLLVSTVHPFLETALRTSHIISKVAIIRGSGGQDPLKIVVDPLSCGHNFIYPQLWTELKFFWNVLIVFHWKIDYFKFSVSIIHQIERFEIRNSKMFWGGAHRAPSPDPSFALSWASPSIRSSPDSGPELLITSG